MKNRDWLEEKLGDILKLEYGKPLPDLKRKSDGVYPVYGANGIKNYSNDFLCDKPSIIVGRKGSAGELHLAERKFWPLDVTYYVTFDDKKYDLRFLYHLLDTLDLPKLATGVKPGINRNVVYSIDVKVPPIDEQKRIVGILDEVFEGVAKAKENVEGNLRNVSEVFEAYLQSVFANRGKGWEENSLGNVCEIYQPRTISTKEMKHDGPYVVYGANGVIGKYDKYNHEEPQLLITCRGATCGSVNISTPKAWINGNAMVVRPKDASLEREFLTYFFRNGSEISKTITGAAQPQITRTTLAPLKIGFPKSLSEQKSIVTKLDALSTETKKLEAIYKTKLDHLEELKKSILKKAFNGEL